VAKSAHGAAERQVCRSPKSGHRSAAPCPLFATATLASLPLPRSRSGKRRAFFILFSSSALIIRRFGAAPPSWSSHKLFSCLVVVQMLGGGSSSRGRGKGVRKRPLIVWEGSLGLNSFEEPIEQFPLESKSDFTRKRPLRSYNNRTEDWLKCRHGEDCVVQMYNDCDGGGRRFFRCPRGFIFSFNSYFFRFAFGL
jgi:hypothetical protein